MAPASTRFSSGHEPGRDSRLATYTDQDHSGHPRLSPSFTEPTGVTSPVVRRSCAIPFVSTLTLRDFSTFAATVLRVSYGIELSEANDKYFKLVKKMSDIGEDITVPGRHPVEAIPILRFLPEWFPGAYFKRYAARAKREIFTVKNQLFESSKTAMVRSHYTHFTCVLHSRPL